MKTPVTTYRAPTSLPIFAAVCGSTRPAPAAPRFCSSSSFCSSSRSTTRTAALAARSEIINPAIPFWSASKLSLSCPYEPPLSNGKTAIPGRVSCPWARPRGPPTAGHSRTAVPSETIERASIACSSNQRVRVAPSCAASTSAGVPRALAARRPAIPQRRAGVPQPHGPHAERAHRELPATWLDLSYRELGRQGIERYREHRRVHLLPQDRLE